MLKYSIYFSLFKVILTKFRGLILENEKSYLMALDKFQKSNWGKVRYIESRKNISRYLIEKSNILDYGCGNAFESLMYKNLCSEINLYDKSKYMMDLVKLDVGENKKYRLLYSDDEVFCNDKKYDLIMFHNVLAHIDDYEKLLSVSRLKLSKNGIMSIINVNDMSDLAVYKNNDVVRVKDSIYPVLSSLSGDLINRIPVSVLMGFLKENDFEIIDIKGIRKVELKKNNRGCIFLDKGLRKGFSYRFYQVICK